MSTVYAHAVMVADAPARDTRSTRLPGPGSDIDDNILKARQAPLNKEPFTSEHRAAYAAFAGITDRALALDLHRHHVTWDDINAFASVAGVDPTDYATMKRLRLDGIPASSLHEWRQMALRRSLDLTAESLAVFVTNNVSVDVVETYYDIVDATPGVQWATADITCFITNNIAPAPAAAFARAGIQNSANVVYLDRAGCKPETVNAVLQSRYINEPSPDAASEFERDFVARYRRMAAALDRPPLVRVAIANNASVAQAQAWNQTGETLKRIDLFLKAGISADEWTSDTTVRAADEDTLTVLAALAGTTPHPSAA